MGKFKLVLAAAMVLGLTLALVGIASAATISCGGCHGTTATSNPLPNNADNCNNNARGLHGTHANYSSPYYSGKRNATDPSNYTKCALCHVNTTTKSPTTTHNNNYANVTGVDNGGKATNLDYSYGTKTCTASCHRNNSSTAKWGNYTATVVGGIKLNCDSCHDDSGDITGLSYKHSTHLATAVTITGGQPMNSASNAGCLDCHPDNRLDLWSGGKADDGSKKAYPHASDGTNVSADKASLANFISGATQSGPGTTCTNTCHPRSSTTTWNSAFSCNMCHYCVEDPATQNGSSASNTGTGALSGTHNTHFDKVTGGVKCSACHPVTGSQSSPDTTHITAIPLATANVTVSNANFTWSAGSKTCAFGSNGQGCHGDSNTSPAWGTSGNGCAMCHKYPGGSQDWATGNGHSVKYAASAATNTHLRANGDYSLTLDTYSSVTTDSNKCATCHTHTVGNPNATHNNDAINVTPKGNGACGGNFTIVNNTTRTNITCGSVKCHSNKETPNWW